MANEEFITHRFSQCFNYCTFLTVDIVFSGPFNDTLFHIEIEVGTGNAPQNM